MDMESEGSGGDYENLGNTYIATKRGKLLRASSRTGFDKWVFLEKSMKN